MRRTRWMQAAVLAGSLFAVGALTGCEDGYKVFVESAVLYPTGGARSAEGVRVDRNRGDVFVIPAGTAGVLRVGFESQTQYVACTLNLDGAFVLPVTRVTSGLFYVERRVPAFAAGRRASGNITCQKPAWPASTFVDTFDLVVVRSDQRVTSRPAAVDFGSVRVGQSSAGREVSLTNTGSAPVAVTGLTFGGAHPADYRVSGDSCTRATLRPGRQCRVQVVFAPGDPGALPAVLRVETDGSWVTEEVALVGTGIATGTPAVQLEPLVVAFGDLETGQSATRTVFVTNTGTAALTIGRLSLIGDRTTWFTLPSDGCSGRELAPQAQCQVRLTFSPPEVGHQSATLQVPTNAGTPGVAVSGNGVGPACTYPYC